MLPYIIEYSGRFVEAVSIGNVFYPFSSGQFVISVSSALFAGWSPGSWSWLHCVQSPIVLEEYTLSGIMKINLGKVSKFKPKWTVNIHPQTDTFRVSRATPASTVCTAESFSLPTGKVMCNYVWFEFGTFLLKSGGYILILCFISVGNSVAYAFSSVQCTSTGEGALTVLSRSVKFV